MTTEEQAQLGTKKLESAILTVAEVAEAAAVPVIDDVRGRAVEMYIALKPGVSANTELEHKVAAAIETHRQDRTTQTCVDRARHAQDPIRQDHVQGDRGDLQLRRRRRHLHPGQPGNRGGHPPPHPGGDTRPRRPTPPTDPSTTSTGERAGTPVPALGSSVRTPRAPRSGSRWGA